jgi:hypothetical protein
MKKIKTIGFGKMKPFKPLSTQRLIKTAIVVGGALVATNLLANALKK